MTAPLEIKFTEIDADALAGTAGKLAILVSAEGKIDPLGRRLNRLSKGSIERAVTGKRFEKLKEGEGIELAFPAGMQAVGVMVVKLSRRASVADARKAGATLAKFKGEDEMTLAVQSHAKLPEVALGLALRAYSFTERKSKRDAKQGAATVMTAKPEEAAASSRDNAAVTEGVFFTRDLVNEPANILTTEDFAARLAAMQEIGLEVEIIDEPDLVKMGMGALVAVGLGSESASKVVVMRWNGGSDEPPFALVGKGVVFDTGGISIKPAAGMEDMTMDMGGAGVVAGVMRSLALRRARANVVGLVGLVENMPDSKAQRPGDIITSMKGDTIEVINTDAEGRLVLADVLWYAQETYKPSGIINLATLTGAMIIALGHDRAGAFSNNDALCDAFLKAAEAEGEGAWRMPLGESYDEQLKSDKADMKNVGSRAAGSITAAQFLQRFVKPEVPWIHLDIAGVAQVSKETDLAPKGPTGWGVLALDRLIRDRYENGDG